MSRHCVDNMRRPDGTIDYNLIELGIIDSYDNIFYSSSDNDPIYP